MTTIALLNCGQTRPMGRNTVPRLAERGDPLTQAPPPLEEDTEVIRWMLFGKIEPAERDEFFAGLLGFRQRVPGPDVEEEFSRWWTSWLVSIRLHADEDYQRQRKESLARYNGGDGGPLVGAEDLRERF